MVKQITVVDEIMWTVRVSQPDNQHIEQFHTDSDKIRIASPPAS